MDEVRVRMCAAAPPARERERWHALWARAQGWPAARVAAALGRDPHTVGTGLARFRTALDAAQRAVLKAAILAPPRAAGIDLADWNCKVVQEFVRRRFALTLGRSSCVDYPHRLDFVLKRPKKRFLKADAAKRAPAGVVTGITRRPGRGARRGGRAPAG